MSWIIQAANASSPPVLFCKRITLSKHQLHEKRHLASHYQNTFDLGAFPAKGL